MFFADRYVFYIWTKAFLDLFLRYILLASVDTDFMASYNQKKWIFLIKGLTTGSGHHCSSSRLHICLLVTAPPDRPPEPTNALIKPLSLWFGATNGFLQLILLAFCPTFPSSFGSFSQWVTVVVWAADQENTFQKKYWGRKNVLNECLDCVREGYVWGCERYAHPHLTTSLNGEARVIWTVNSL